MEKKYNMLRFVATLYKILAWIFLILGILGLPAGVIYGVIIGGQTNQMLQWVLFGVGYGFGAVIAGAIYFVLFMSIGQFIYVFLDIENNTRKTYLLLEEKSTIVEQVS
ncbi:MAG TPA: hypothetical protein ENN73_02480 [Firmicutes bacterium]|nr:hypothetical protein [Bacillota bacterium]